MGELKIQEWWLVRHAPVHLDSIYGQMDVEADYSDDEHFDKISSSLVNEGLVLSSDLQRCTKTAQKIIGKQGRPEAEIHQDSAFREQCFGDWQGLTYDQAEKADIDGYNSFWLDPARQSPPGGESFAELAERVNLARQSVTTAFSENKVLLVTHAGVIRAILAYALNIPISTALSIVVDPLSHTKLTLYLTEEGENWRLDWVNRI